MYLLDTLQHTWFPMGLKYGVVGCGITKFILKEYENVQKCFLNNICSSQGIITLYALTSWERIPSKKVIEYMLEVFFRNPHIDFLELHGSK